MRQFYVYGFKSRMEYADKSLRSYDNERRRIESWLGSYMSFRQSSGGKRVFLSVDSRSILHNPLYKAFKAKSFTDNDITLHFYILDILADGRHCTVREIAARIDTEYRFAFESFCALDESTIRKKLKEYETLGLLKSMRQGRELFYARADVSINMEAWRDALSFFSEADPLGVVGSFLLDRYEQPPDYFTFKQHYILYALESEVLLALLEAIAEDRTAMLQVLSTRLEVTTAHMVLPLKLYVSAQTGRRYLLSWHYQIRKPIIYRLDHIQNVRPGDVEPDICRYRGYVRRFRENLWGVSTGVDFSLDHVEMTLSVGADETSVLRRLVRERRCGQIHSLNEHTYRFVADVYDATEMLPWIRSFIGNIQTLTSNNTYMVRTFYEDLEAMKRMYGGDDYAVQ